MSERLNGAPMDPVPTNDEHAGHVSTRNLRTGLAAVKLGVFVVVSVIVTGTLAIIMGHLNLGSEHEYKAIFSSASELKSGDDVRVAGVSVGSVTDVSIYKRSEAIVTFKVTKDLPLTTTTGAEVRFLNLVGDRYLALTQCPPKVPLDTCTPGTTLSAGATIGDANTQPALNLTALFAGFQPLFQVLSPHDVDDLAMNIIRVLQGEGGTVQQLLAHTASLTNALADRDQLVGQVITNLSGTLDTIDQRHQQLDSLLVQLKDWMGHLAKDRNTIGVSLQDVSSLTQQLAQLVTQARPFAKEDIAQLRRLMTLLNKPQAKAILSATLQRLPTMLRRQARIGTFGSWYNYYLCDFTAEIKLPELGTLLGLTGAAKSQANGAMAQLQAEINKYMTVHSTVARCDG
ncbi:MAG TPA: MCE family protein [Marmoricola sp.]|nr:MCE family protein [Marmoricola sp.]